MIKEPIVFFTVMTIFGILFNGMNMLVYKYDQFYFSLTLFYIGCLMASTMFIAHEVIHFITHKTLNYYILGLGFILTGVFITLLRLQVGVNPNQWMMRMIPHHSTALTTTKQLLKNHPEVKQNPVLYKLCQNIISSQTQEIELMKRLLNQEYLSNKI